MICYHQLSHYTCFFSMSACISESKIGVVRYPITSWQLSEKSPSVNVSLPKLCELLLYCYCCLHNLHPACYMASPLAAMIAISMQSLLKCSSEIAWALSNICMQLKTKIITYSGLWNYVVYVHTSCMVVHVVLLKRNFCLVLPPPPNYK